MKHTLTEWQFFLICINFIVGSALLKAPLMTAMFAKQDAWLAMLLTIGTGLILMCGGLFIYRRYNYAFIYEIMEHLLGRFFGTVVNIIIVFFAIHTCAIVVRNLSNFMAVIVPGSSHSDFQIAILVLSMYTLIYGMSNFGRVNDIFSPIMFLSFVFSMALIINRFTFDHFQPMLVNGWMPVVHGSYTTLGFSYIQLFLMASIMTYVHKKEHMFRLIVSAIVVGGLSLLIVIACVIGVEGYYFAERAMFPAYALMRGVTDMPFIERVEALVGLIWVMSIFIKIVIAYFTAVAGVSYIAKRDDYRPLLLPIGILIWAMANHLHPNIVDFTMFIVKNWTLYTIFGYFLILGIMLFGIIRKQDRHFRNDDTVRTGIVSIR